MHKESCSFWWIYLTRKWHDRFRVRINIFWLRRVDKSGLPEHGTIVDMINQPLDCCRCHRTCVMTVLSWMTLAIVRACVGKTAEPAERDRKKNRHKSRINKMNPSYAFAWMPCVLSGTPKLIFRVFRLLSGISKRRWFSLACECVHVCVRVCGNLLPIMCKW